MSTVDLRADSASDNPLSEAAFALAVHHALRDFNRPDQLRLNLLTTSRLVKAVLERSPALSPTQALREIINAHCTTLGRNPKYRRYEQVLEHTYFTPQRRQRAVADVMHLSWGSYRRYLSDARAMLIVSLWEAECQPKDKLPQTQTVKSARVWPWMLATAIATAVTVAGVIIFWASVYLHKPRRTETAQISVPAATTVAAAPSEDDARDVSGTQDLYLVGLEYLHQPDAADIQRAIQYFHKSVQADPENANAWAALATAYALWPTYADNQAPDAHYQEALAAADKALALDSSLASAHAVLGYLHAQHWEWPQAKQEYQLALRLDPYSASTQQSYAKYFWLLGDVHRALRHMRAAHNLNPKSGCINANLGRALTYAGSFQAGQQQLLTDIVRSPRLQLDYEYLAETYSDMKQYRQVLTDVKDAAIRTGSKPDIWLLMESGVAEAGLGRKDLAGKYLLQLERMEPSRYVSGVLTAKLYWTLGDKNRSFAELQRAAKEHDQNLMIVSGPDWTEVRADPHFAQIRALMNLSVAKAPHVAAVSLHNQP